MYLYKYVYSIVMTRQSALAAGCIMGIFLVLIYVLFKQDGWDFALAMLCVLMFKSVRVGLVHLLPCYVKSVAVTVTERDVSGRELAIWPCLCKFLFCVQIKRRKKTLLPPAGLFCLCPRRRSRLDRCFCCARDIDGPGQCHPQETTSEWGSEGTLTPSFGTPPQRLPYCGVLRACQRTIPGLCCWRAALQRPGGYGVHHLLATKRTVVRNGRTSSGGLDPTNTELLTVTGERTVMPGKKLLSVVVGTSQTSHEFWLADIRDECIVALDLLAHWEACVDVPGAALCLGAVPDRAALVGPEPSWTGRRPAAATQTSVLAGSGPQLPHESCRDSGGAPGEYCSSDQRIPAAVAAVEELGRRSGEHLSALQQEQLQHLLRDFVDIFAAREEDCTRTALVQHHIDTGPAAPIRLRPHRLPLAKRQAAEEMIRDMAANGIIETSDSPVGHGAEENGGLVPLCGL